MKTPNTTGFCQQVPHSSPCEHNNIGFNKEQNCAICRECLTIFEKKSSVTIAGNYLPPLTVPFNPIYPGTTTCSSQQAQNGISGANQNNH